MAPVERVLVSGIEPMEGVGARGVYGSARVGAGGVNRMVVLSWPVRAGPCADGCERAGRHDGTTGGAAGGGGAGRGRAGAVVFRGVLFQGEQFGYRDAAHFYHPLYLRVQQEWEAGRVPLWEPEENGGMPLLGNPTAAVLYPGKLVFAVLDYEWATRVYTIGHVALAALGMRLLMRGWGLSWCGASITALSYAFGAPVLFQYCNIVFLVGAAWLPFGLRAADQVAAAGASAGGWWNWRWCWRFRPWGAIRRPRM